MVSIRLVLLNYVLYAHTVRPMRGTFPINLTSLSAWMVMLLAIAGVAGAAPTVKEIRASSSAEGTRVVLDLSEPVNQKLFTLDKPHRVVLDIPGAQADLAGAPQAVGVVQGVRIAKRENGDLRVVFDVQDPVQARAFAVAAAGELGPRLVIDLAPPGASLPTMRATTPAADVAVPQVPAVTVSAAPAPAPTPMKPPALPAEKGMDLVIAIDAGHGGQDPGAIGRHGSREKNVTLAIARQLKEKIDAEPGMRAVLTRDGDYFLPLRDRINRARKHQAHMFVSIHADAVPNRSVRGSSVYVLSSNGASSEAARYLADRENAADLIGGVSLNDKNSLLASVLLDLQQGVTMNASAEAASLIIKELDNIGNVHHLSVQQAGFAVLKSPDIPSILVETAFISNPAEEAKLGDAKHQDRLATAIFAGVKDYFYTNPPPGTRVAQIKAERQAAGSAPGKSPISTVY